MTKSAPVLVRVERSALAAIISSVPGLGSLGQTPRELREKANECARVRAITEAWCKKAYGAGARIACVEQKKRNDQCDAQFRAMVLRAARLPIGQDYPEFGTAPFATVAPSPGMPPIGAFPGAMTAYVPPTVGAPPLTPLPPRAPGFRMTPTMVPSGFQPSGPAGPGVPTPPATPQPPQSPAPYKSPAWVETGYAKATPGTVAPRFPLPFNVFGGAGGVAAGGFM